MARTNVGRVNIVTGSHSQNFYQNPEITIPSAPRRLSLEEAESLATDLLSAVAVAREMPKNDPKDFYKTGGKK